MSDQNNSLYENSEYPSRQQPPRQGDRPARPRKKRRRGKALGTALRVLGTLLLVMLCTGVILCCFGAVYIKTVIVPIADLSLDDFQLGENSVMYYQDKESGEYKELTTLLTTTSSIWVDYDQMPENLVNATIAIEDKRFWSHPGVDWRRTGRAVLDMFTGKDISGGSTITQQLIKNLTDYNETTVKRKVTEIVRALRFTQNNSKTDTVTWYLNIIPLGSGCEGVGAASYAYFGKPVSELSLAECASLIAITNNPSKYGPYSPAKVKNSEGEVWTAKQWNKWRQENILYEMLDQGLISQAEYDQAIAEELVFVRAENEETPQTVYSWYEETVISDVKKDLMAQYDISESRASQLLSRGGLRIYTCIDPDIQAMAEAIYTDRANLNYTSGSGVAMQSSITILDNATGNVVAIVGQFGEKTKNLLSNYANTSQRQPGSAIKPLSVYAPGLELDLISPISVVDDYPYDARNGSGWPINSGAARYKGLTTIRSALTNSINTIAVRVLSDKVTPQISFNFVQDRFHINLEAAIQQNGEIKSDIDVAPLAMGGLTKGVSTRDMAEAYATFPNNGVYTESRTYTRVEDSNGNVILENEVVKEPVIKDTTAYYINSMLTDVVQKGTAAGYAISGMTAAGKTGTTSENFDRWFVGYTPYYTAAVWTGYPKNEKMRTQGNPALILWKKVMTQVHQDLPNKKFPVPSGLVSVKYCLDSGLQVSEFCAMDPRGSRAASDSVFQSHLPSGVCTVHTAEDVLTVCKDCPILDADGKTTGLFYPAGPYCPEESLVQMCLPNYERELIGRAVAQDNMFRKSVVEAYGTCIIHISPPVIEVPLDPEFPGPGGESGVDEDGLPIIPNPDDPPPAQDIIT